MVEENKCCSEVMKKHFNKGLVMNKRDNEYFKNSTKCSIWDNTLVDGDIKVRDHFLIKHHYDSLPIMKDLAKFSLKKMLYHMDWKNI